jgi:two-component system response regulator NreC
VKSLPKRFLATMNVKKKHRILIAEDHTLFRQGLKALLSLEEDFEVVGEAGDGRQAIQRAEELKPDLILLDISMPRVDGMTAIKEIKRSSPEAKIVILTVHNTEEHVLETLKSGASGYILKDASHEEFLLAMRSVLEDKRYLSPDISARIVEGYLNGRESGEPTSPWKSLTPRERQVLKLIAEGYKSKDIGQFLCISEKTVAKHRSNIMNKLDLHSASELTAYAIKRGLVGQ